MRFPRRFPRPGHRWAAAFSLVEVALALGIVGFALVGIVGAIPIALDNERSSVAQTRASGLANTVFATLRSQPFNAAQCTDDPSPLTFNLNTMATTKDSVNGSTIPTGDPVSNPAIFYAAFDEVPSKAPTDDMRRLHFTKLPPATTPYYQIELRFNNQPVGTLAPHQTSARPDLHAQGNAIEATIFPANRPILSPKERPKDVFRFTSVIANRSETPTP